RGQTALSQCATHALTTAHTPAATTSGFSRPIRGQAERGCCSSMQSRRGCFIPRALDSDMKQMGRSLWAALITCTLSAQSSAGDIEDAIEREAKGVEAQMIAWRQDIHQQPELGNSEVRTSALVASHLRQLGLQVREKIAHTGVIAIISGSKPGPVI